MFKMKTLFLILFTVVLSSCSTTKITVALTSDVLKEGLPAFYQEEDYELARSGLESNLKLLEVFLNADKKNKTLKRLLAQAFGGYTFIFLETDLLKEKNSLKRKRIIERAIKFYVRERNYGLSVLSVKDDFKTAMAKNNMTLLKQASYNITDKEGLFWTIFNWALLINLNKSSVDTISGLPKLKILVDRMLELDEGFFYGAPLALKATLECALPRMLGGKPAVGIELYKKALKKGKREMLMVQLLYAQYGTPSVQDKKAFLKLYNEIMSTPDDINKDILLINKAVKIKAPAIKESTLDLFMDDDDDDDDD